MTNVVTEIVDKKYLFYVRNSFGVLSIWSAINGN